MPLKKHGVLYMSEEGFECVQCGSMQAWCDWNLCKECGESCCDNCAATYGIKGPLLCRTCCDVYNEKGLPHD